MMDNFKSKSPRNQFPTILVKSSNSSVGTIEDDDDNKAQQKLCFYYAFKPIYFFSRFVGLMPFSVVRSLDGNGLSARVTVYDIIWFIISIASGILLAVIDTKNMRLPQSKNESLTINVGDHLLLIVGLSVGTFSICLDMFNRKRIVKIIENFESFDKEVSFTSFTLHDESFVA